MDVALEWSETRSSNSLIKDVPAIWAQSGFEYKTFGIQTVLLSSARHCSFEWNCLKRSGAKKIEHGKEVVEWVPGKLKVTLHSTLPTVRPPTRRQHTNFRGVRRIDFNVDVFTETATRTTVTYFLSTEPCRGLLAPPRSGIVSSESFFWGGGKQLDVFTELSTDPKAILVSRICAPPPGVVVRTCSRQHPGSHHRNFTHTLHSPALHGCGWCRQFCIPLAAPQPSVCDSLSSPTSCC